MGKPLFKASEGADLDILRVREDCTESEVLYVSGEDVLLCTKVRPEAFPTAYPCPFIGFFCNNEIKSNNRS